MSLRVVPTLSGDAVTTYAYDLLFDMLGPEGVETYRFDFLYNERMDRWTLSIFDAADRVVVRSAIILMGVDLLKYATPGLRPRGGLLCIWKSDATDAPEPGLRDLGAWAQIVYASRASDVTGETPIKPGAS